jgi:hypothetical protein
MSRTPMPSTAKAPNMVRSRPRWSETQPKNGRVTPFMTRSSESAKVTAGRVIPRRLTGTLATPNSRAMGASSATITNMTYMVQNIGVASASPGR